MASLETSVWQQEIGEYSGLKTINVDWLLTIGKYHNLTNFKDLLGGRDMLRGGYKATKSSQMSETLMLHPHTLRKTHTILNRLMLYSD